MRLAPAVLALLLTTSACAVQPAPVDAPRRVRPLRAYVSPPTIGQIGFYVSRPAYVAMFEVVPGRGTSLVYPGPGYGRMDGFVFGGSHHLHSLRRPNAEQYLPVARHPYGAPRFFFLIASDQPLDLDRFGGYGMGLRSAMGMQFASLNAYASMETLASLVLPRGVPEESWTTDLYVHWPEVLYDSPSRRVGLVRLHCNGYSMYVPFDYIMAVREAVCAPRDGERPQPNSPQPRDSVSAGETGQVQPRRRPPLPRTQAEELRERITSSSQLEEPVTRRAQPRVRPGDRRVGSGDMRIGDEPRAQPRARSGEPGRRDGGRGEPIPAHVPRAGEPRGSDAPRVGPGPQPAGRSAPPEPVAEPSARPGERGGSRAEPQERRCSPCSEP